MLLIQSVLKSATLHWLCTDRLALPSGASIIKRILACQHIPSDPESLRTDLHLFTGSVLVLVLVININVSISMLISIKKIY